MFRKDIPFSARVERAAASEILDERLLANKQEKAISIPIFRIGIGPRASRLTSSFNAQPLGRGTQGHALWIVVISRRV
jgi:hypothetical protein